MKVRLPFFCTVGYRRRALAETRYRDYMQAMTQLLERAFAEASKLPNPEQDAFAALLLAELDSERRWAESFASTQDELASLADEALREFEAGQTQPMDLERDFPNH